MVQVNHNGANYWLNRKNCCVLEMGLVAVFCPLTTTGAGELLVQAGDTRFEVDCRVKPVKLVDHVKITLALEAVIFSSGCSGTMASRKTGTTWNPPVFIGENTPESDVQARQQIAAADGRIMAVWQRERPSTGGALPIARLGYNRSIDSGSTWLGLQLLPGDKILATDTNIIRDHHQIWMTPGGGLHIAWAHGPPGDPSTPMGYIFSPDYGATWAPPEIAIPAPSGSIPKGVVADDNWVHIMADPGLYLRRHVPPVFRSIRRLGQTAILEWAGQGTLQQALELNGPWEDLTNAISPQTLVADAATRFFRIKAP